jgi:hypothetical protein
MGYTQKKKPSKRKKPVPKKPAPASVSVRLTQDEINIIGQVFSQIPWKTGQSVEMALAEGLLQKLTKVADKKAE